MKKTIYLAAIVGMVFHSSYTFAQQLPDSLLPDANLRDCIKYALSHQPVVRQSLIDEAITEATIKSKLADWYPQINLDYNIQHYLQIPTSYFQGNPVRLGVSNNSTIGFSLTQNLFNRDVLLASRSARDVRQQAKQTTASNQIDVITNVSKAYYNVLLTKRQITVLEEDIIRLERSQKDAYNQYQGGIVDKTDYKRANISLNNAKAQRKTASEQLNSSYAVLRELMGYPNSGDLKLVDDTLQMESEVSLDTSTTVTYENRIEYQLLQTQQRLLQAELKYNKWSLLPTVSAFANYNAAYLNNEFSKLYQDNFPNSLFGLKLSLPIFQGFRRTQNIRAAELQLKRTDWDFAALKNQINTEYTQAMSAYKSSFYNYVVLRENMQEAKEVYDLIALQYKEGVKTYLEVITSETDLRTAQINYFNALYEVLSSKIDLQKALGTLTANN
ncbi:TolC family protein [Chitinophaga agrisoli]|uniref:TolC family protein n=1 Tax=Chitinophaga agrisoli TaxID=2607653 RepID=A0A5B2VTI2_9BACT|nr:TolC family protein [Chitinophaga agrisoli]KAA2241908.1 TolC family protein [Chitinophaga agrisoli]